MTHKLPFTTNQIPKRAMAYYPSRADARLPGYSYSTRRFWAEAMDLVNLLAASRSGNVFRALRADVHAMVMIAGERNRFPYPWNGYSTHAADIFSATLTGLPICCRSSFLFTPLSP